MASASTGRLSKQQGIAAPEGACSCARLRVWGSLALSHFEGTTAPRERGNIERMAGEGSLAGGVVLTGLFSLCCHRLAGTSPALCRSRAPSSSSASRRARPTGLLRTTRTASSSRLSVCLLRERMMTLSVCGHFCTHEEISWREFWMKIKTQEGGVGGAELLAMRCTSTGYL